MSFGNSTLELDGGGGDDDDGDDDENYKDCNAYVDMPIMFFWGVSLTAVSLTLFFVFVFVFCLS